MRCLILPLMASAALIGAGCGGDEETTKTANIPSAAAEPAAAATTPTTSTAETEDPTLAQKPEVAAGKGAAPKELQVEDLVEGTGEAAKAGDTLTVDYVGVLHKNGKEFDSSWNSGTPFTFELGSGGVIQGWDQGLEGMKVGGRRQLTIPANLAYGSEGSGDAIPPNSPLIFVVDLKEISG